MRYFGLLDRPKTGHVAVSRDVEQCQFALDEALKRQLRQKWLRSPAVFDAILQEFPEHLPSEATLRYQLINRGFNPASANDLVAIFQKSAQFADVYSGSSFASEALSSDGDIESLVETQLAPAKPIALRIIEPQTARAVKNQAAHTPSNTLTTGFGDADQIPVRVTNARKAWLIVPSPLYERDKIRLKVQIDLLLCDDAEVAD